MKTWDQTEETFALFFFYLDVVRDEIETLSLESVKDTQQAGTQAWMEVSGSSELFLGVQCVHFSELYASFP